MLSIIIPAHNEEKYIEACLQSIHTQKHRDYEIIVVCDACTDQTETIARHYTKKVYAIHKKNVSAVRNLGAANAKGDILVFLDADSIIAPDLLIKIHETIKKGYVGGTAKTKSIEPSWKAHLIWALGNFFRHFFLAASGMLFCDASAFPKFDESRKLAEDSHLLLALKKKGKLRYITDSFIKTSARRFEKEGYIRTIYTQFSAFFINNGKGYLQ